MYLLEKLWFQQVSTGYFPVSLLYLTIALPIATKGGNQVLYVTNVETQAVSTQLPNTSTFLSCFTS